MNHTILQKIDKLFGSPDQFSPENMETLVHETIQFFNELKTKLESSDEKVREEALQTASLLKTKLEEQALKLCESIGMDPQSLESYISSPANFSSEEWQAMEKAKSEIKNYKDSAMKLESGEKTTTVQKKKKRAVKEWIVG